MKLQNEMKLGEACPWCLMDWGVKIINISTYTSHIVTSGRSCSPAMGELSALEGRLKPGESGHRKKDASFCQFICRHMICMFVSSRYGFLRSVDQKRAGGDDGNSIKITSMCYPPTLSPVVFNEQLKPVPSTGRGEGERESFWEGLVCFGRLGKNWPKHHQHHHPQNTSSIKNTSV